jgi:hypothetical protein
MPRRLVWFSLFGMILGCLLVAAGLPRAGAVLQPSGTLQPWAFVPLVVHEVPPTPTAMPTLTPTPTPTPSLCHVGYGANVADRYSSAYLIDMGFDWAKGFADPADRENPYDEWKDVANQLDEFLRDEGEGPRVRHVLLRIRARGYDPPPLGDLSDFRERCYDLAAYVKANYKEGGLLETIAYEIWNEPNLKAEWGWRTPSPSEYVSLLAAAHKGIEEADTEAIVVSAGLATGGDYDDLAFLEEMYLIGADAYFDALGSHPYGGNTPPSAKNPSVYFRRAEEQRAVMVSSRDGQTPVWATEFSWIVERPDNCADGHSWAEVTEQQQADYLVAAFQYADEHWPWMGPMFLILDFGTTPWYEEECEPLRWYSIYYRPWEQWTIPPTPRPAVSALTAMQKCSAWQ